MRRVRNAWYWLRSFFKSPRSLDDYPVIVTAQPQDTTPATGGDGSTIPPFVARIDGMFLAGFGDSAAAARADLALKFAEFQTAQPLPRPGTQQMPAFAPSAKVDAFTDLRDDFVSRVLHLEWAFISDESSLDDFPEEPVEYDRRIMLLYGIDVDRLPDRRIVTILGAIARR